MKIAILVVLFVLLIMMLPMFAWLAMDAIEEIATSWLGDIVTLSMTNKKLKKRCDECPYRDKEGSACHEEVSE